MKRAFFLCLFFAAALARADIYRFTIAEIYELDRAFLALDGYERVVDQGPGNPAHIVREPYKFARETRAKLGANRAALIKASKDLEAKLADVRLKISDDSEKIDDKDPEQLKLWKERTREFSKPLEIELSPITTDELTANDNPIPISVLSVLNQLRPKS